MARRLESLALGMIFLASVSQIRAETGPTFQPKTLVVAFDGLGQQYFQNQNFFMPWFEIFRKQQGVYSTQVRSVFPSETFPNFYSMATGLYPESHGIVGNEMYDPHTKGLFNMSVVDPVWWSQAEPIWITAKKAKPQLKVAAFQWPGTDVVFPGELNIDYVRPLDYSVHFRNLIDDMVRLMTEEAVDLGFLYHAEPDGATHKHGNKGSHLPEVLTGVDWLLSYLLVATENAGLTPDILNIVICSDHGMANIEGIVNLDDYIDVNNIHSFSRSGVYANIWPKDGFEEQIYTTLKAASEKSPGNWTVYRKHEVPARFHYLNNDRIAPIMVMGSLGTWIAVTKDVRPDKLWGYSGYHGYDPNFAEMRPTFMARGPAFKKGVSDCNSVSSTEYLETKDIYALLAHLIGLTEENLPPINASLAHYKQLLADGGIPNRFKVQGDSSSVVHFNPVVIVVSLVVAFWIDSRVSHFRSI